MISDSQTTKRSSSFSDLNSRYNESYPHIFKRARCQSHHEVLDIQEIIVIKSDVSHDDKLKLRSKIHTEFDSDSSQSSISNYPLLTAYQYHDSMGDNMGDGMNDTGSSNGVITNNVTNVNENMKANNSVFKSLRDDDYSVFNGEMDVNGAENDIYYNIPYPYNFDQRRIKRNCARCCFSCLDCCKQTYGACAGGYQACHQNCCPHYCHDMSNTCLSVSLCCLTGVMLFKNWLKNIFTKEE